MKGFIRLVIVLTTLAVTATASSADKRIRTMIYDADQVYRLHGWVGYHIDIQFEKGEMFVSLAGGDLDAITYAALDNHLSIKPHAAPMKTNLTVITSRRVYVFDYSVSEGDPDTLHQDQIYSLRFEYTDEQSGSDINRVSGELQRDEEYRSQNRNYWFCGDASLRPVEATDDGVHTRLRFSPRAEIPAFFVKNDDKSESLLNFSIDPVSGDIVIHRTVRRLILRRGNLVGCVVNQSYTGPGERLESGTVSPRVQRTVPEVRP